MEYDSLLFLLADINYQVIDDHYYVRLNMYQKRKDYQLDTLIKGIQLLESKMRFIEYVIDEEIQVYKKSKQSIIDALKSFEFSFYENNRIINYEDKEITSEYNYLLNVRALHVISGHELIFVLNRLNLQFTAKIPFAYLCSPNIFLCECIFVMKCCYLIYYIV